MAKLRVAYEYTEAEDKSIRLGLFLIISGVVSLFIFGFCWLSPALQDLQATAANCTVLSVQQIGEVFECTFTCGADCRGTSQYPCVQVYVNNSESNSRALLHSDEHQLLTNPKVRTPRAPGAPGAPLCRAALRGRRQLRGSRAGGFAHTPALRWVVPASLQPTAVRTASLRTCLVWTQILSHDPAPARSLETGRSGESELFD